MYNAKNQRNLGKFDSETAEALFIKVLEGESVATHGNLADMGVIWDFFDLSQANRFLVDALEPGWYMLTEDEQGFVTSLKFETQEKFEAAIEHAQNTEFLFYKNSEEVDEP